MKASQQDQSNPRGGHWPAALPPPRRGRRFLASPLAMLLFLILFVPALPAAAETLFTTQTPALTDASDGVSYELGMKFQSAVAGPITAIRYWKAPSEPAGNHVGRIWDALGNPLASVTFVNETASGWQQQALATPLQIQPNTTYVVSVNVATHYVATVGELASAVVNGNLSSVVGDNGVFGNSGVFPTTGSSNSANYFRDVVFETTQTGKCISGEKYVSVTGSGGPFVRNSVTSNNPDTTAANPLIASVPGTNNVPAATVDIPTAFFGGTKVFYQFVITNCGTVDLYNVRLDDCADLRSVGATGFLQGGANGNCVENPRLIPASSPGPRIVAAKLTPGQSVTVTSATFAQDPISTIDMCTAFGGSRTDGIIRNDSQAEANTDMIITNTGPTFVYFDDLNLVQCKPPTPNTAKLGDRVWQDLNRNGIQDCSDTNNNGIIGDAGDTGPECSSGVPNATVNLRTPDANNNCTGAVLKSTTTNNQGFYLFDNLSPGTYCVQFVPPNICAGNTTAVFTQANAGTNDTVDSDANASGLTGPVTLAAGQSNLTVDAGVFCPPPPQCVDGVIGGVDLGGIANKELFFFANGSQDANWQGATKGFAGNVVADGILAKERTSGGVPYAGTISTNDSTLSAWQSIVNQNPGQAFASFGNTGLVSTQKAKLIAAFQQINALPVMPVYSNRSSTSLNGLNTQNNNQCDTIVINVTSGFQVSSKLNITGDLCDVFILRWDTDQNFANGYQGQVKFQSGGALVPLGGLRPANFIHVAGDINSSGGGSNPLPPYPQGPRLNDGTGALINGGSNFSGGGFFTGYWLTTGAPTTLDTASGLYIGKTAPQSNGIFVGGWYTLTNQFSLTSGTSGVYVSPKCE